MTKEQTLDAIKLIASLESWCLSLGKTLPDHLWEDLQKVMDALSKEILK